MNDDGLRIGDGNDNPELNVLQKQDCSVGVTGFSDAAGGNDASPDYGDPTIGTYHGRPGVAMDGNDGLRIGNGNDNPELSFLQQEDGPVSIAGWVYFDQQTGGSPNNSPADHHILRNDSEYVLKGHPVPEANTLIELQFRVAAYSSEGEAYNTADETTDELRVPVQQWIHFAFVITPADSIIAYINGKEVFRNDGIDAYSARNTDYWSHQTIGSWYGTGSPDWYELLVGKLSDLRIYDGKLSTDDVAQIYENTRQDVSERFALSLTATNAPVPAGEKLSVEGEVENTGTAQGTQSITLETQSGTELDTISVTLDPGATEQITLSWNTDPGDTGESNVVVVSEDDTATERVVIKKQDSGGGTDGSGGSFRSTLRNANKVATVTIQGQDYYILNQIPGKPDDQYAYATDSHDLLEPKMAADVAVSYEYCENYTYDSQRRLESTNQEYSKWNDAEQLARTANLATQLSGILSLAAIGPAAATGQVASLAFTTIDWAKEDITRPYHEVFSNIGQTCATLEWANSHVPKATQSLQSVDTPALDILQTSVDAVLTMDDFTSVASGASTVLQVYQQADSILTDVNPQSINGVSSLKSAGYAMMGSLAISLAVNEVANVAEKQAEIAAIGKSAAAAQRPLLNELIGLETLINNYSIGPTGILRMQALRQVDYQIEAAANYGISQIYQGLSEGALGPGYDRALGTDNKVNQFEDNGSTWEDLSLYTAAATGKNLTRGLDRYQESLNYSEYGSQPHIDYS